MIDYGLTWPGNPSQLEIEMAMIRGNGYRTFNGVTYGKGLPHHYEAMRKLLWPRLDDHRWHRLCRDEILKNKVTVLLGCGSSGKTHESAWLYLCEYFCFPDETCVLVSSTDLRGLRLRVWGEITMLWQEAVEKYDFLPGHLLESRIAITTDEMIDGDYNERRVRDMRKGIVGIPTIQGGKFVGLGKFIGIKQKRLRLIADEACFPAGTMVDTPSGERRIETINPGDAILNALGTCIVRNTMRKRSTQLVKVTLSDGRSIACTPTHPFFTQKGWKCACDLDQSCAMIGLYESMQILRQANEQQDFLYQKLLCEVDDDYKRGSAIVLHERAREENIGIKYQPTRRETRNIHGFFSGCQIFDEKPTIKKEDVGHIETHWSQAKDSGWKRDRTNKSRESIVGNVSSTCKIQLCCENREAVREWLSTTLQGGRCVARMESGNRGRWKFSLSATEEGAGCEKVQPSNGTWVDSVEVIESQDFRGYSEREGGVEVYNLEVASHPSYSVNGLLVHNSAMGSSFLSAFANLNKNEDFRAIVIGNPNDPLDPLGKAAEPLDGWSAHLEPKKTEVWKTRFMNGTCVNLIGTDSPNFDFPDGQPTRYKYLISREKIADTLSFFPKDSFEYYSQCVGCMKVGTLDDRIITRELCRNNNALDDVIWSGKETIKIAALDAAYGGDRAVCGHIEFGEAVGGQMVLAFNPPQIVPVSANSTHSPEEQLAEWILDYCKRNEIVPEHFFHDSTGRGGLGTAIARVFSSECVPVEFGGSASDRPVAEGLYTWDMETQTRRLAKCNEHYDRCVSELWYQFRYAVESKQIRRLPEDVTDELCMRKWTRPKTKIRVETKQEMKERIGRSPDLGDWAALCLEGARRLGFMIEKFKGLSETGSRGTDYLTKELNQYRREHKRRELHYK